MGMLCGNSTCTRESCRFISRTGGWRSALTSGRHAIRFHQSRAPKNAVPFGFCSGGFSSTAGYVPGNEACVRRLKRLAATSRPIISPKARLRFYPRRSRKSCDFLKPSLSASARSVIAATAACCHSQVMRHRNACLSPRWSRRP